MPLSINWNTKVIFVPKSYLTPIGGDFYSLDVNQFRLDLKNIEDSDEGMVNEDTHRHNTEVLLSGVTYARSVEIINGYGVEFEDDDSEYTVFISGANHNIADVRVKSCVSIVVNNSAGLISVATGGSGLTAQQVRVEMDTNSVKLASISADTTTLAGRLTALRASFLDKIPKLLTLAQYLGLK
jgi:hypothetical protein